MNKLLRYSLVSLLAMFVGTVFAEKTVTIDFNADYKTLFPTITGESSSSSHDGDFTAVTTSTAVDGVTVTITPPESGTESRIWGSDPRLRVYGGSVTFTSSGDNITKMVLTIDTNSALIAKGNTVDSGTLTEPDKQKKSEVTWTGDAKSVTITIAGNTQFHSAVLTLGGEAGGGGETETVKTLYTEAFTANQGKFSIDDKTLPEGLSYVWKFQSYGATASAYANSTAYAAESWLISPIINLAKATETSLEFTHALNKFADVATAKTQAVVLIKAGTGSWQTLDGVTYPDALSWTFVENAIDLSEFDGQKIQIAFKYTSTAESAGTWEIKPFTIKGKGEATIEFEAPDPSATFANIGALYEQDKEQAGLTDVVLTLGSDAQVLYVNGNNMYVRDSKGAICLYKSGIDAKANQMIAGPVRGDLEYYGDDVKMAEFVPNSYFEKDGVTVTDGTADAEAKVTTTLDKVQENMCDLVKIKGLKAEVETSEGGSNTYYVVSGETKVLASQQAGLRDYVESGAEFDMTAVVGVASKKLRLYPITIAPAPVDVTISPESGDLFEALQTELGETGTAKNVTISLAKNGKYTVSKSIEATGAVIINGAEGAEIDASALEEPVIKMKEETLPSWVDIGEVKVNDVKIKGLKSALFYSATKNYAMDLTIDNTIIEVAADVTVIDFTKGSTAKTITFMNNTVYAPTATTKQFYSSQAGQKTTEYDAEAVQTFKFHNNTMYNLVKAKNFFSHRQSNQKWLAYDVKNNLFVNCGKTGQVIKGMNGGQGGANPTWTIDGNAFNFDDADTSANEETGDADEAVKNSVAGVVTFTDAANGDFNGTFKLATGATEPASLGDPRWTLTYSAADGIFNVKAADAVNAPIFNMAGQRVNDTFKGVVIQNGKKFVNK